MKYPGGMASAGFNRASGGSGMGGWLQATCSCGWKSPVEYAYEDYQHTTVKGYADRHIRENYVPKQAAQGEVKS